MENKYKKMRITGIVLLVIFLLVFVAGVILFLLMDFTTLFSNKGIPIGFVMIPLVVAIIGLAGWITGACLLGIGNKKLAAHKK